MSIRVVHFLDTIRQSFWFIPTLMAAFAVALALGMIELDERIVEDAYQQYEWVYGGGADGARAVLSTIAGSVMTVTGVVFSITMAAFTLAAQQYGPRLLGNFMRDQSNQFVLGVFISTFLYCLLVLRSVQGVDGRVFVPHIAVTVGLMMGTLSVGVLIYFIHHAAESIQVSTIISRVGDSLDSAIDRLFPTKMGYGRHDFDQRERENAELPENFKDHCRAVTLRGNGYLLHIDDDELMKVSKERDLILKLLYHPGDFLVEGTEIIHAYPGERLDDSSIKRLQRAVVCGNQRQMSQDVEFGVHQLAEIAVRALSPGINDPFTAMMALDRLAASLSQFVQREIPSRYRFDEAGKLRVVVLAVNLGQMMDPAFHQIRQNAAHSAAVLLRMLITIETVSRYVRRETDRLTLLRFAELTHEASLNEVIKVEERMLIAIRYEAVKQALNRPQ